MASESLMRLKEVLREMVQLDGADSAFGLYRVLGTLRQEIDSFLQDDLPQRIHSAARRFLPDHADPAPLEEAVSSQLATFFRRYYDADFPTLRRYKPGRHRHPPCEVEEITLHWAGADHYYVAESPPGSSSEYFIHKDLGGFLRRELDHFVGSEVLLCGLDAEMGETIARARAIKDAGRTIVGVLEQLENFQKRLWLKKKLVVGTEWCVTLDRVPKELFPAIRENAAQLEEWRRLFAIEEVDGFSDPPTLAFLEANPCLVVDTAFFSRAFTDRLVSSFGDLDDATDGILIHGDNFHALNLIAPRIAGRVSNIYIDPPYNTGDESFFYKDHYSPSCWLTMMQERLAAGVATLSDSGVAFISIGDEEQEHLATLLRQMYGKESLFATLIWEKKKKGTFLSGKIARMKDYILCLAKDERFCGLVGEIACGTETYPCVNASNPRDVRKILPGIASRYRLRDVTVKAGTTISAGTMNMRLLSDLVIEDAVLAEELVVEGNWRYSQETMEDLAARNELYITQDLYLRRMVCEPRHKRMKDLLPRVGSEGEADFRAYDIGDLNRYGWGTNEDANHELHQILGEQYAASYPKPSKLLTLLLAASRHTEGYWVDYFAGSGTTGHAVINLNREDGHRRKFVLVEAGDHFRSVLMPRITKVVYSREWSAGKPVSRSGSSHVLKYLRLENYRDSVENLQREIDDTGRKSAGGGGGGRDCTGGRTLAAVDSVTRLLVNGRAFIDPFNFRMKISTAAGTEALTVDLVETFNWLLGIVVRRMGPRQWWRAGLSPAGYGRFLVDGELTHCAAEAGWSFQAVEGETASGEKVLVIWRTLPGGLKKDNAVLEEWFKTRWESGRDFRLIYVNGESSLENSCHCPVRRIEAEFIRLMFDDR